MPDETGRTLQLTFTVGSERELSPTDFIGLFECVDTFVRHLIEHEALQLFEELNLPSEWRLTTLHDLRRIRRKIPAPAEITRIQRGSWEIVAILPGAAVLWFLKSYVHPVVQEAWNDSRLRQTIIEFLRERIFRGAKRSLEQKAVEKPRFRSLEVASVDEPDAATGTEAGLHIRLERREVIQATSTDAELIDDFLRRIRG